MTNELKQIAIQILPALIERSSTVSRHGVSTNFEFNHEAVVRQAYKFAEEVVRQGGGK